MPCACSSSSAFGACPRLRAHTHTPTTPMRHAGPPRHGPSPQSLASFRYCVLRHPEIDLLLWRPTPCLATEIDGEATAREQRAHKSSDEMSLDKRDAIERQLPHRSPIQRDSVPSMRLRWNYDGRRSASGAHRSSGTVIRPPSIFLALPFPRILGRPLPNDFVWPDLRSMKLPRGDGPPRTFCTSFHGGMSVHVSILRHQPTP